MGSYTPFLHCFRDREKILDLFEETCGARLLYNYNWVGGLMYDIPAGFEKKVIDFLDYFEPLIDDLNRLLSYNYIFIKRTANVGMLPADVAINYGITGPNLRGSGVKFDVRKDEPYLGYEEFDFDVPVGTGRTWPGGILFRPLYRADQRGEGELQARPASHCQDHARRCPGNDPETSQASGRRDLYAHRVSARRTGLLHRQRRGLEALPGQGEVSMFYGHERISRA